MGAQVEEEYEFGNDTAESTAAEATTKAESSSTNSTTDFSPELLSIYYSRLFPFELLHNWLSYDPSTLTDKSSSSSSSSSILSRREFSTTIAIEGKKDDEIYKRYQSFSTQQDLALAIRKQNPLKIDIGAVFNIPPKDKKSFPEGTLQPSQRELVFDIDLTDYDPIRNCGCTGADICIKCWKFMVMAVKVMDVGLREDFGFRHLAWVYSGRRGVHCWVCDEGARGMSNEARGCVAGYFEVTLASEKNKNTHLPNPPHPMLTRSYKILEPYFISSIIPQEGHGLLTTQASWTNLLLTLPDATAPVSVTLEKKWKSPKDTTTPQEKWQELKSSLQSFVAKSGSSKAPKNMSNSDRLKIQNWPIETVFKYTYPRLDINVSKGMNHLLKSPFCVHPKTGRVCVPFEVSKIDDFDPFAVPTLGQLMKELDGYNESSSGKVGREWEKTSLKGSFEGFEKGFLIPLLKDVRRGQREERERRAAVVGDF